jgi:hypothetical protein
LRDRASFPADVRAERDLRWLDKLRRRPQVLLRGANILKGAHQGKRGKSKPQREWLYHRLCTLWLENFGARDLRYGRPKDDGDKRPPTGPLIDFILVAMALVMPSDEVPTAEAVSDGIDRVREERANAARLARKLRERKTGRVG